MKNNPENKYLKNEYNFDYLNDSEYDWMADIQKELLTNLRSALKELVSILYMGERGNIGYLNDQ